MVELEQITLSNKVAYEQISLGQGQEQFVHLPTDVIRMHFDEGYGEHLIGIKYNGHPVGILTIHSSDSGVEHSLKSDKECWLRSFIVDASFQGKGIASQSVKLLTEQFLSGYQWLSLTVNLKNIRAIAAYEKMGFKATGELYYGGPAGPQQIMRKQLEVKPSA